MPQPCGAPTPPEFGDRLLGGDEGVNKRIGEMHVFQEVGDAVSAMNGGYSVKRFSLSTVSFYRELPSAPGGGKFFSFLALEESLSFNCL